VSGNPPERCRGISAAADARRIAVSYDGFNKIVVTSAFRAEIIWMDGRLALRSKAVRPIGRQARTGARSGGFSSRGG